MASHPQRTRPRVLYVNHMSFGRFVGSTIGRCLPRKGERRRKRRQASGRGSEQRKNCSKKIVRRREKAKDEQ
eukprot:4939476-Pleurochrysis_carterae.AAC.1